jgi:hypothetical protein
MEEVKSTCIFITKKPECRRPRCRRKNSIKVVKGKVDPVHDMKVYRVQNHSFWTWAIDGNKWLTSRQGRFISR